MEEGELERGSAQSSAQPGRGAQLLALLVCLALAYAWVPSLSRAKSLGWDEAMHAALPAARMLLGAQAGAWRESADVLLDCQQYPPAFPAALALWQAAFGLSEHSGRECSRVLWVLACWGLFQLGAQLVRRLEQETRERGRAPPRALGALPWLCLALGAASPLALAYAGTYFLELPFLCVAVFALRAWLRRSSAAPHALWRELGAGAWLALALFTKWNYGLLLGFALALDLACEAWVAVRAGRGAEWLKRASVLAVVPVLACSWWFVLPLPGGLELGHAHLEALRDFLLGNQDASMSTPWSQRLLQWSCMLSYTPRLLALEACALLVALPLVRLPAVRALLLVLLAASLPVALHNFQLDRFLLPNAPVLWVLAAVGLCRVLPARRLARGLVVSAMALAVGLFAPLDSSAAFEWCAGFAPDNAPLRAYQVAQLDRWRDLSGDRELPTAGLTRAESEALLDAIAPLANPDQRVAWLGVTPEFSPGALHLGLLERGGAPERLRRDAGRVRADGIPSMLISFSESDPHWSAAQVEQWARGFDVVFTSNPLNLKGKTRYDFLKRNRDELIGSGRFEVRELGTLRAAQLIGPPVEVRLFACLPL